MYVYSYIHNSQIHYIKEGKANLVRGRVGPWGCETSRIPHLLDNRLTDSGEAVVPCERGRPLWRDEPALFLTGVIAQLVSHIQIRMAATQQ
jgi:hypothetical protein